MFTGIVQTQAIVDAIEDKSQFRHIRLKIKPEYLNQLEIGASIAVNGCCLTVVAFDLHAGVAEFDIIDETLRLTNLGELAVNDRVNVERSLTMGRELGGHIVSGHIHCTGTLTKRDETAENCAMYIDVEPRWLEYILPKGFIAVNGASLTIGKVDQQGFWLHLIPETLSATNLGSAGTGSRVNLEMDQQTMTIVETVKRVLAHRQ